MASLPTSDIPATEQDAADFSSDGEAVVGASSLVYKPVQGRLATVPSPRNQLRPEVLGSGFARAMGLHWETNATAVDSEAPESHLRLLVSSDGSSARVPLALRPIAASSYQGREVEGDGVIRMKAGAGVPDCSAITPPDGPVPFDGETTASGLPTELRWNPVPGATSYQVVINGFFVTSVPTNIYVLPSLPDLTYTWQITAEVPSCGLLVPGPTWSFTVCTLLPAPLLVSPFDGETTRPENIQFDWTDVPGSISYRFVLDNFVSGDLFDSNFSYGVGIGIASGIRQWAASSRTSCGFTTAPLTTFCVLDWAVNPIPGNGGILCESPTVFRWDPVASATRYDVLIDGVVVGTSIPLNQFNSTGTLASGTHTWQVISYNVCGQMPSEVWTFEIGQSGSSSNLAWQTDGVVHAVATDGTRLYVGGEFEHLVSPTGTVLVPRRNIAALDLTTGQPTDWNPGTDGTVFALVIGPDRVYAGGDFTLYANAIQNRVGAVTNDRGLPVPFDESVTPNLAVRALALSSDASVLYVGGDFNRVGTTVRRHLAGISTSGGGLTAFNPDLNNRVRALLTDPSGDLFVGGIFNLVGSTPRNGVARLTSTGSLTPWNANCDLYVYAIKRGAGGLLVGGFFTTIGGSSRTNLALLDLATGSALPWNPQVNGTVVTIEPDGDGVFVGGLFGQVGAANRPYMARVSASTGVAGECGYDPDNPVRSIAVGHGTVWAGGDFTYVSGRSIRGLAGFGQITPPPTVAQGWELYD